MGTNVIGLDIGTNAVRAVELGLGRGRPVVKRMGQVALPLGAVIAGEVMDSIAVSEALRRLWKEAGFTGRSVVAGVANPRVVARMADLPALPDHELRSALPFQVQDLIPIPVEEAELDFQVIERGIEVDGESLVRVLLVAAHRDMLRSLLAALEGAGLNASRIDLIPFALIRALHDPATWLVDGAPVGGHEVIIGSGAGVTNVVVHENGLPRFVRTLPTGGAAVTDALAQDLGIDGPDAEAVKRGVGDSIYSADQPHVEGVARDALLPLAHEVAGSLDFHLAQVGQGDLRRVVLAGGAGRLRALRAVLQDQLGVPVVEGDPYAGLDLTSVPLDARVVAASADVFAVAIGLALSGAGSSESTRISLLPAGVAAKQAERRQLVWAGAAVGGVAAALVALTLVRGMQINDVEAGAVRAERSSEALTAQVAGLHEVETLEQNIASGTVAVRAALAGEIGWTTILRDLNESVPDSVGLVDLSGARASGQINMSASGVSQQSTAVLLQTLETMPTLQAPWLQSSSRPSKDALVAISTTARFDAGAFVDRTDRYVEEGK